MENNHNQFGFTKLLNIGFMSLSGLGGVGNILMGYQLGQPFMLSMILLLILWFFLIYAFSRTVQFLRNFDYGVLVVFLQVFITVLINGYCIVNGNKCGDFYSGIVKLFNDANYWLEYRFSQDILNGINNAINVLFGYGNKTNSNSEL
jgi:hypothetical protein